MFKCTQPVVTHVLPKCVLLFIAVIIFSVRYLSCLFFSKALLFLM